MKHLLVLLCCVLGLMFSSCYDGASDTEKTEAQYDDETTVDDIVGKWDRHNAESQYT